MTDLTATRMPIAKAAPRTAGKRKSKWLPLWFLLPAILVLLTLQVYPTLYSIYLSTTRVRAGTTIHVGLDNFQQLLGTYTTIEMPNVSASSFFHFPYSLSFSTRFTTQTFIDSLERTGVYSGFYLLLTIGLGLMLALLLNRRIKFTGIYLVIIFLPWVISDVVAGTMWRWMFEQTYGIIQVWLNPIIGTSLYTNANGAMGIVIMASVWRALAFTTLLFLGALQTVPTEIQESAALDGANRYQRFFYVIFPMIRPTFLITILLTSIRAINSVGLIFSITKGGPGRATQTIAYYLYDVAWNQGNFGLGAAISVVLFVINIGLTLVYLRLVGRRSS